MGSSGSRRERYFESPTTPTTILSAFAMSPGEPLPKVLPSGFCPGKKVRAKALLMTTGTGAGLFVFESAMVKARPLNRGIAIVSKKLLEMVLRLVLRKAPEV